VQGHHSKNNRLSQAARAASQLRAMAQTLLNIVAMKRNANKTARKEPPTLAELISTVNELTRDEQLGAYIVADLINSRKVRLEGEFQGRRVVIA
jgi:hypothetical protein